MSQEVLRCERQVSPGHGGREPIRAFAELAKMFAFSKFPMDLHLFHRFHVFMNTFTLHEYLYTTLHYITLPGTIHYFNLHYMTTLQY